MKPQRLALCLLLLLGAVSLALAALGVYALWVLLSEKGKAAFEIAS